MTAWHGKVVIVTGGSSGFGLSLARAYARASAHVVIAARGADALETARERLAAEGLATSAVAADVTREEDVRRLVHHTVEQFGRLDCLVNNAGRSARGRVLDTTPEQFQELWELNFLGLVRMTRAAAPHLLQARGHVVNVSSLAGKRAARWIGAYPPSKFAVTAYSEQLRLELADEGLHVLLVCPGPIAREGGPRYSTAELHDLPASAQRPGGGVKLRAIDPDWLARRVVRACDRRQAELVVPGYARWLFAAGQLWPSLGDWLVKRKT